jgi:2-polyprenyl-6-methoxyphenol hydroxylase-like FAD-dependent oxidoreductase
VNILIVGAGVAGLTLAYWLERQGHQPAIVERAAHLR